MQTIKVVDSEFMGRIVMLRMGRIVSLSLD